MTYSEAIKLLRKKMILSQTEFAKLLEVSFPSINRWETGKFEPTARAKRKLNELFKEYDIEVEEEDDSLTGLINAIPFSEKVDQILLEDRKRHALLLVGMDDFKLIDKKIGRLASDKILQEIVSIVRSLIHEGDLICRFGGDEFLILLKDIPYDVVIETTIKQISNNLNRVFLDDVQITASIGIAEFPLDGKTFDELCKKAEIALYKVKKLGKNNYAFFNDISSDEDNKDIEDINQNKKKTRKRMLIVDDDEVNLRLITNIFKDEFIIETAKNGVDALLLLQHFSSTISVLLLDLIMPTMDGFEVLRRMKDELELQTIPTIVVSGLSEREIAVKSIEFGAVDFILKPIDANMLRIKVKSAIGKAENDKLRAQNNYLLLQKDKELKYRVVLSNTGTVVIEYNWITKVFVYDDDIAKYLAGTYDNRSLWTILFLDHVADSNDVKILQESILSLANNRQQNKVTRHLKLMTSNNEKHWFIVHIYKKVDKLGLAEKMLITFNDVNEEFIANQKLIFQATHDELTGLYNRTGFIEKASELIAERDAGYYVMACIDIDRFKVINDQFGTEKGDEVLRQFGQILARLHSKDNGICCRVMADNFAILYPTHLIGSKELDNSHDQVGSLDGSIPSIHFTVGRCIIDDKSLDVSSIYDRAILAKETIKGRYDTYIATYDESMRTKLLRQQDITRRMKNALENSEFEVWFQPQFNHVNKLLSGAEALVRWRHPDEGLIAPNEFIPIFEKNGFIYELDKFVWEKTCVYIRKWLDEGLNPVSISVNISRYDIFRDDIVDVISKLVKKYEVPTDLLRLEITESAFSENSEQIIDVVEKFVALGFVVEIDDFGSGYSSLNTLKDVPAQVLKMDMRFFESGRNSLRGGSIIESVVRMAKWLNMSVIAEGVETIEQADYLSSIGCEYIQGFLYSKPRQIDEYELLFKKGKIQSVISQLKTLDTWNNSTFWDPKSMDSLIFNSYIGGACIFEYKNQKTELLRYNSGYTKIFKSLGSQKYLEGKIDLLCILSDDNTKIVIDSINKALETKEEISFEIQIPNISEGKIYINATIRQIAEAGERYLLYMAVSDISEKREAEKDRLASAVRLEAIMDNINGGVAASIVKDGLIHYIFANNKYYELMGYTKEEYENQFNGQFLAIHPDDRKRTYAIIRQATIDLKPYNIEFRLIRKNKDICWLNCNVTIIRLPDYDDPIHLVAVNDTTMLHEAQQKENELSKQIHTIMDNIHGGITATVFHDDKIDIVFSNDGFYEMHGYTKETMAKEVPNVIDLIIPEDYSRVMETIKRILKTEASETYEYRCHKRDGNIIAIQCTNTIISIEGLGEKILLGITTDITELRNAQESVMEYGEKLNAVMNHVGNGITALALFKDSPKFIFSNDRYYEIIGYDRETYAQLIKNDFFAPIHPDDKEQLIEEVLSANENADTIQVEYRIIKGDGSIIWIRSVITITTMKGIDAPVQIAMFADITAEKEADEQLRFLNETAHDILAQPNSDLALKETLAKLLRFFKADRGYIIEIDYEKMISRNTFEVCEEGVEPEIDNLQAVPFSYNDYWYRAMCNNEYFTIENVEALGDDQKELREFLLMQSINSLIFAPLWRDGKMIGFVGVDNPKYAYGQINKLTALSDYMAILLTRRDLQQKIISDNEEIENLPRQLLDNFPFGAALYEFDGEKISIIHINKRYWKLVDREPIRYSDESVLNAIHPNDVALAIQEIKAAAAQKRNALVDLRIRCGKSGYKPFRVTAVIEKRVDDKYQLYVSYTPISEHTMSIQEMLPVALKSVMNASNDVSFVKDRNLRYICASRKYLEIIGIANEDDIIGKRVDDIFSGELVNVYNDEDQRIMETGNPIIDFEANVRKKDNMRLLFSKYPILDSEGNILGIYGTGHDITEAKIVQSRLELLTNNIPGGVAIYESTKDNPENIKLTFFSDGLSRLFGYSHEEYRKITADNPFALSYEEDIEPIFALIRNLVRNNEPFNYYYRSKCKNGSDKWINVKALMGESFGEKITANAIFIDVTDQMQAGERVRISEEEFRIAADHSNTTVCRYDVSKMTLTFSSKVAERLDIPEVLENIPYSMVDQNKISIETRKAYIDFYESIMGGKKENTVTFKKLLPNGWRWITARGTTLFDNDNKPIAAIISYVDVTEQQEKEIAFRRLQQRLVEKGSETYTLITCNLGDKRSKDKIDGNLIDSNDYVISTDSMLFDERAKFFAKKYIVEEDQEQYIDLVNFDKIFKNYKKGNHSMDLELRCKIYTGEIHWLKLTVELVEYPGTKDIFAYFMFEDINVEKLELLRNKQLAETDPLTGLLNRNAFVGLFKRSIEGNKDNKLSALLIIDVDGFKLINDIYGHTVGDEVLISTGKAFKSLLGKDDFVCRLGGDEYLVYLSSMRNRDRINEKAKEMCLVVQKMNKLDISLSISIGISLYPEDGNNFEALYHKADKALYSVKEQGKNNCAFYDILMEKNEKKTYQNTSNILKNKDSRRKKMLIVDDDENNRQFLKNVFVNEFEVVLSENGQDALVYLSRNAHDIEIMLLDLFMPGLSGLDVLKKLKENKDMKEIPVIVCGLENREENLQAIYCGAADFVSRPINEDLLRIRVASAISKIENERFKAENRYLSSIKENEK